MRVLQDAYDGIENIPDKDVKNNYYENRYKNEGYREAMKALRSKFVFYPEQLIDAVFERIIQYKALTNSIPEGMDNVEMNFENMAFVTGAETPCQYKAVKVGEMHAVSSVGEMRSNQEDAVALINHPDKPEFKLMVVADGMGGCDKGEIASDIAVKMTGEWFLDIDVDKYFEDVESLAEDGELGYLINSIESEIVSTIGQRTGGTTFCCTIVGKTQTVVLNIGDSRAYMVNKDGITQVTEDDSFAYQKFKEGKIGSKDDIRFYKRANQITACLGQGKAEKARYYTMSNDDYSSLVVCSDGVTDVLSDEQLYCVCKDSPRERIAANIASRALDHSEQARYDLQNDPEYEMYTQGGRDNTTVAVFSKPEQPSKGIKGLMAKLKTNKNRGR